jgi:hypothetical protein
LKLDWNTNLYCIQENDIVVGEDVVEEIIEENNNNDVIVKNKPKIWWSNIENSTELKSELQSFIRVFIGNNTTMVNRYNTYK